MARKKPKSEPAKREIWHADFLIETTLIGCAADHRSNYDRIARQLHRMTFRPEYGRGWVPQTAFEEIAATGNHVRRSDLCRVLLDLYRELGDRIRITGSLAALVEGEWSTPPNHASWSLREVEDDLIACIRGDGKGTRVIEAGRNFAKWRQRRKKTYAQSSEKWTKEYKKNPVLGKAIKHALEHATRPKIYDFCDDLAAQLIEDDGHRDRKEALKLAKAKPDDYPTTWTFALLARISQFAQTIPTQERAKGPFGGYTKLLKPHVNDTIDATIAALGARCGFMITEDSDLRERIEFLRARGLCRLYAVSFADIEANWHPPSGNKDPELPWIVS